MVLELEFGDHSGTDPQLPTRSPKQSSAVELRWKISPRCLLPRQSGLPFAP
jgi:hypothetical protein